MQNSISNLDCKSDAGYERAVRCRMNALKGAGVLWDLRAVLPAMRGVPPELLLRFSPELAQSIQSQESAAHENDTPKFEPHPLDYAWRFLPTTVTWLANEIGSSSPLVLMGVPSLFERLANRGSTAILLDRNPALTNAVHADFSDRRTQVTLPKFERVSIVLDSPWYFADLVEWINFAVQHFDHIDRIYFSLWPELVRESAPHERLAILRWLEKSGDVRVTRDCLAYEVPIFERLAYRERGIVVDFPWRRGDLVTFEPSRPLKDLAVDRTTSSRLWKRYLIDRRQIAILDVPSLVGAELSPIGVPPRWHLDSVSRRDPIRDEIQFWTSNNVVAGARGHQTLISAISDYFGQLTPFDSLTVEQRTALNLIRDLGCIEFNTQQAYVAWQHRD